MAGKFEIFKDKGGDFRFRLVAGNGETILSSQGYKSKASTKNGVESVRKNSSDEARFEKSETSGGKHRFTLHAANKQVIGTSQNYASTSGRNNGIKAVDRAATGAKIVDLTE